MEDKVRFLKTIESKDIDLKFEEGKEYNYIEILDNEEIKDEILIQQPNSTDKKPFYCRIPKHQEGKIFEYVI